MITWFEWMKGIEKRGGKVVSSEDTTSHCRGCNTVVKVLTWITSDGLTIEETPSCECSFEDRDKPFYTTWETLDGKDMSHIFRRGKND
ncbi:MAG: hypothetical protein AAB922_07460 [Patescibacteria group bacterium]